MLGKLRYVRVFIAIIFLVVFILLFLGIPKITPGFAIREIATYFQFIPSILRFLSLFSIVFGGFIIVILITALS